MSAFDQIVTFFKEQDPYRAEVLLEMESRLRIAAALFERLGGGDLADPSVHKILFDYYDRVCDAFDGEFDQDDNRAFGSDN